MKKTSSLALAAIMSIFYLLLFVGTLNAQNVGIGTTSPNSSAMLDITASNKGLLIPRTSTTSRTAITNPAKGLMVYDTTSSSFWYNNGSAWVQITSGANWSTTGNSGTNSSTNFIGTTDAQPLAFKVNGLKAGFLDNNSATANTSFGYQALSSNTIGFQNTANGYEALYSNKGGFVNTANGVFALFANTTGSYNSANGFDALSSNTAGYYNTANGDYSLSANKTGYYNTANGYNALTLNTSASNNTANGSLALSSDTSGHDNTAEGVSALYTNITGNNNTALGSGADITTDGLSNATAIGAGAIVAATNTVQIGNSDVTDIYFGTPSSTILHAKSVTPSDARFKYNIKTDIPGLDFILQLKPVSYNFNVEKLNQFIATGNIDNSDIYASSYNANALQRCSGFLAQDVEKAAKAIGYDFDGIITPDKNAEKYYSLSYSQFVIPLVKAVQELNQKANQQQDKVDALEKENAELKQNIKEIQELKVELVEQKKMIEQLQKNTK